MKLNHFFELSAMVPVQLEREGRSLTVYAAPKEAELLRSSERRPPKSLRAETGAPREREYPEHRAERTEFGTAQREQELRQREQELRQWEQRLGERQKLLEERERMQSELRQGRQITERMDALQKSVAESVRAMRQLAELEDGIKEETRELRKEVSGQLYRSGLEKLARLCRSYAGETDAVSRYVTQTIRSVLSGDFELIRLEPQPGSRYIPEEQEPNNGAQNCLPVVRGCSACGWKMGDTVLLPAVVELEVRE